MDYASCVGHTLEEAGTSGFGLFARSAVFVLEPDESDAQPGRQAWEGFGLARALEALPELRTARIVAYNKYMGEHVFRVRKEKR